MGWGHFVAPSHLFSDRSRPHEPSARDSQARCARKRLAGLDVSSVATDLKKRAKQLADTKIHLDSSRFSSNLAAVILFHKILSLVIIVLLLFMLEHFFGVGWALEQTTNLFRGREWHESAQFPRVTFCDAEVREMGGQVHTWTVQCVLMVNMFNEKIFFFIWWSLIIIFVLTALNILDWIFFMLNRSEQKRVIMSLIEKNTKTSKSMEDAFVTYVMRRSGASFVRLLSFSVSHFEMEEVVRPLWDDYLTAREKKTDGDDKPYIDDDDL